ncbi:hypothetical protein C8Q70DRAFT_1054492 [Cubamyces menziesii]|nr:hypothetical protein C8Q70DRAFT_1054492 [Cubamyces menziesii]
MKGFLPDATAPGRLLNLGVRFTLDEAKQFVRRLLKDDFTDDYLESPKYGRPVVLLNHVKWYLEDMLYDEDSELYQFRKLVTFVSTPSHQQHKPACGVLTLHPRVSWPYIQSQTGNAQKVIDDVFARVKATLGCNEMELQWHFSTYEFSPHWRHNGPWKPFDAEKVLGPWADFYHGPGQGLIVNDENLVPY